MRVNSDWIRVYRVTQAFLFLSESSIQLKKTKHQGKLYLFTHSFNDEREKTPELQRYKDNFY